MSDVQGLIEDKGSVFKLLSWGLIFVLAILLPHDVPADFHKYKFSEMMVWFMAYSVPPSLVVLTGIIIGLVSGQADKNSFIVKLLECLCGVLCLIFGVLTIINFTTIREGAADVALYIGGILSMGAGLCMVIDTILSFTG